MKKMEENVEYAPLDFVVDESPEIEMKAVEKASPKPTTNAKVTVRKPETDEEPVVNILRNERITIRHIPKPGMVDNPKHVLYGGMAESASRTFVVPRLRSGAFVNVLTDKEKAFLEEAMGLEYGALSSVKRNDNFWDDANEHGISKVRLLKQDNYLDLSDPSDYIRYKILLANKDLIAPSIQALQDDPKATYEYVIISEGDENKKARDTMSNTMKCYKEFGKYEDNFDVLRVVVETISGRPVAKSTKLEFLQTKANEYIQADAKLFLKVITDQYLSTKVLIKNAVDSGIILNRDNHYYLTNGNLPLCEANEESTLYNAAKFLNTPKHQDVLFAVQAKLKA